MDRRVGRDHELEPLVSREPRVAEPKDLLDGVDGGLEMAQPSDEDEVDGVLGESPAAPAIGGNGDEARGQHDRAPINVRGLCR
jgi:hypothetical protein